MAELGKQDDIQTVHDQSKVCNRC